MVEIGVPFTMIRYSFYITVLLLLMNLGLAQNDCRELRCASYGPPIRFPFGLVDGITNHCGYPGFRLSCTNANETMLELPTLPDPVKLRVTSIDYKNQTLDVSNLDTCPLTPFQKPNHSSISPFPFEALESETHNITFFNCSTSYKNDPQFMFSCPIYTAFSDESVLDSHLLFCAKMFEAKMFAFRTDILYKSIFSLRWSKPSCGECERQGKRCILKNNGTEDIECYSPKPMKKIPTSTILASTGGIVGTILLGLLLIAFFHIYRVFRNRGEDQARVEKFLEDYKAFRPTRFSYADIKRITNHFKDKLGEGAHGVVYKGKLSSEILVAVKIINNTEGDGQEFINEVGTMGKIHHVNVIRLLGFCADGFHRALVYDFFPNGSLQNFICPPNKDSFLGWDKLQQLALDIAKGIEYLHQGCDHRILHFDINPHNVLLDDNFVPKISDFGLAKLCSKNQSVVSMTAARGTLGYIAPEVFSRNFGNVSYKCDIYSYGMLLLEMVGGRKNTCTSEESFQVLFPEWIHNLVEGGRINIHVEDEEDIKIAKKLAIVGLWCIQWHPVDRPSMKTVIQMLEGEGDKLKVPPTPFDSTASSSTSTIVPARRLNLELEVIHELD